MIAYYEQGGVCYGALGGRLPEGARPVPAPFAPLVFLVNRDPLRSRGIFAVHAPSEVLEAEGPSLLLPPAEGSLEPAADAIIRREGACVLNTAFTRCFEVLERFLHPKTTGLRLTVAGLGDVGGTVLTGLTLLGEVISEIGVFDFYTPLMDRYELELNQVLSTHEGRPMPKIVVRKSEDLFDCDAFLFTATKGVPPVGSDVRDVRMAQYAANRDLLKGYAQQARDCGFTGLFCQISDPVDHLARSVFLNSNRNDAGELDFSGLLPEQIQGYGLGVMEARARYYANKHSIDFQNGAVFGPHGQELIVANDTGDGYDDAVSCSLTADTVKANLVVRDLGFKPYIAPGLSSAAISILATLTGRWHDGALPMDGAYFGCQSRMTRFGPALLRRPLHPQLYERICRVHGLLKEFDYDG